MTFFSWIIFGNKIVSLAAWGSYVGLKNLIIIKVIQRMPVYKSDGLLSQNFFHALERNILVYKWKDAGFAF